MWEYKTVDQVRKAGEPGFWKWGLVLITLDRRTIWQSKRFTPRRCIVSDLRLITVRTGSRIPRKVLVHSKRVLTARASTFRPSLSKIFRSCFLAKISHSSVDCNETFTLGIIVMQSIAVVPIYALPISSLAPSRSQLSFSSLATLDNKPLTLVSFLIFCSSCATQVSLNAFTMKLFNVVFPPCR